MSAILIENSPATYEFSPVIELDFGKLLKKPDDDEFFEFCRRNKDWQIERDKRGEIIIMPPTGWETGDRNAEITMQLRNWAKSDASGKSADSSTGYKLPDSSIVSPDASWISNARLETISPDKRRTFLPLAPDFVVELRSGSDTLSKLKDKMRAYVENGVSLGWLIDADERRVYVYSAGAEVKILENPAEVSGEPFLRGFRLNLKEIWG
jgi:Uma2 family endonuclease